MPDAVPIVTATPTIQSGLVLRWRVVANGDPFLSASRDCVMIHGDVKLATIEPWLDDARRAHELLRADRRAEARAMATHEHTGPFRDDLVPINRPAATKE